MTNADHVTELVGHSGPHSTERDGRDLGSGGEASQLVARSWLKVRDEQVDGDDSPSSLDTGLNEEGTSGKRAESLGHAGQPRSQMRACQRDELWE